MNKVLRTFLRLCACGLLLLLALYLYMRWEYTRIGTRHLALEAQGDALRGIKIVYAADFQYDMYFDNAGSFREKTFQKAVDRILAEQPDLILLGGDYATFPSNCEGVVPFLGQLEAPLGVYGVFGNHDTRARDALASALPNIRFLENEAATVTYGGTDILLYGVADLWWTEPSMENLPDTPADYAILLTHNPDYFEQITNEERDRFDLTLAGHTHAGQVTLFGQSGIPFVMDFTTAYGEKYRYGEKTYYNRRVYTTSGLGGAVLHQPVRFFARPEIVVIEG